MEGLIFGILMMPVLLLVFGVVFTVAGAFQYYCDEYDKTLGPYRPWERP